MTAPRPKNMNSVAARRWLRYALSDLQFAIEANKGVLPGYQNQACYHAQQAIEKAIKAAIVLDGTVVHSHDLVGLMGRLGSD